MSGALQGCGGLLNSTSGRFGTIDATGNGNYERGLDCQWQILVPDGQVVTLTFESLDIESAPPIFGRCFFDYVEVSSTLLHYTRQGFHLDWKTWKKGEGIFQAGNFEQTGNDRENHTKYWKKLGNFKQMLYIIMKS